VNFDNGRPIPRTTSVHVMMSRREMALSVEF
jgi:hypothetical protein